MDEGAVEQYWPATQDHMASMALVVRTDGSTADVSKAAARRALRLKASQALHHQ